MLGLLANGPLHGYELRGLYQEQLMPTGTLNFGQVYPTLERLQREGWVQHDVVSQRERPDKKVYALTEEGQRQLQNWLGTPSSLNLETRNETYLKLMLARRLKLVTPLEILRTERRSCLARLHELTQARASAKAEGQPLSVIVLLDLAVLRLEAFMKWLENCDHLLREEDQS